MPSNDHGPNDVPRPGLQPGFSASSLIDPSILPEWMIEYAVTDETPDATQPRTSDEPVSQAGQTDGVEHVRDWRHELEVLRLEARARRDPDPAQVRRMAQMLILGEPGPRQELSQATGREAEVIRDEGKRLREAAEVIRSGDLSRILKGARR